MWFSTVAEILLGITAFIVFSALTFFAYLEIRDAITEKNRRIIFWYVGVLVVCISVFALCRTVFREPMTEWWYTLRGGPVVTLGENASITWEAAPRVRQITPDMLDSSLDNLTPLR